MLSFYNNIDVTKPTNSRGHVSRMHSCRTSRPKCSSHNQIQGPNFAKEKYQTFNGVNNSKQPSQSLSRSRKSKRLVPEMWPSAAHPLQIIQPITKKISKKKNNNSIKIRPSKTKNRGDTKRPTFVQAGGQLLDGVLASDRHYSPQGRKWGGDNQGLGIGFAEEEEEEGVLGSTSSSLPLTEVDSKARRLCRSLVAFYDLRFFKKGGE